MTIEGKKDEITILINNRPYHVAQTSMSGREIKALAGGPMDYMLILIVKSPDAGPGGDDKTISDGQVVELKSGMRFRMISSATFGRAGS